MKKLFLIIPFFSWFVLMIQTWDPFPSSYLDSTLRCVSAEVTDTSVPFERKLSTLKHMAAQNDQHLHCA